MKSNFHIIFKTYKDKKKLKSSLGKNSENYETVRSETNMYEQRPINIDDFIEDEEKQVKERVEKRKQKRGDVAKKKKLERSKRKEEEDEVKEKQRWERLSELNKEFSNVRQSKKNSKKCW